MPTLRGSSGPLDIQFLVEGHFASFFSLPFALAPDAIPLRAPASKQLSMFEGVRVGSASHVKHV